VKRILAAAEAAGIRIMVHENFRFQTPLIELRQAMAAIGDPFFAHIAWRTGYDVVAGQPYLAEVERFIILDLGIHVLDVARFLLGDVTDIYARTQRPCRGRRANPRPPCRSATPPAPSRPSPAATPTGSTPTPSPRP
jgi:predicted dehydrogenase